MSQGGNKKYIHNMSQGGNKNTNLPGNSNKNIKFCGGKNTSIDYEMTQIDLYHIVLPFRIEGSN